MCTTGEQQSSMFIASVGAGGLCGVLSLLAIVFLFVQNCRKKLLVNRTTYLVMNLLAIYFTVLVWEIIRVSILAPTSEIKCYVSVLVFIFLQTVLYLYSITLAVKMYFMCVYPLAANSKDILSRPLWKGSTIAVIHAAYTLIALIASAVTFAAYWFGEIHETSDLKSCELDPIVKTLGPYGGYFVAFLVNCFMLIGFARIIYASKRQHYLRGGNSSNGGGGSTTQTTGRSSVVGDLEEGASVAKKSLFETIKEIVAENMFVIRFIFLLGFLQLPQVILAILRPTKITQSKSADVPLLLSLCLTTLQPLVLVLSLYSSMVVKAGPLTPNANAAAKGATKMKPATTTTTIKSPAGGTSSVTGEAPAAEAKEIQQRMTTATGRGASMVWATRRPEGGDASFMVSNPLNNSNDIEITSMSQASLASRASLY
jgi:hypothetical protein